MSNFVSYELQDNIATITMDDGKVNTMSLQMLTELSAALDQAEADKAVVLLTGRSGVFSAGFDLAVLKGGGEAAVSMLIAGFKLSARLLAFPTPVVVASNGHALAMGVFIVLAADYRIGVDGNFKVGANEVAIGLTMPHTAVVLCRQRLAPSHFNRAIIMSEIYTPAEALTAGFLDHVVDLADLPNAARTAATRLGKLNMAAFTATKLRAREPALAAAKIAVAQDEVEFRKMMGL